MYIKRVEIENLRCFKGRQGVDLQREDGSFAGWTVFTGRNGTGKTSLLQILVCAQAGSAVFTSMTRNIKSFVFWGCKYGEVFCSYFYNEKYYQIKVRLDIEGTMGFQEIPAIYTSSFFLVVYGARRNLGQPTSEEVALLKNPVHARLRSLFLENPTLSDAITWLSHAHFKALEGQAGWAELRDDVLRFIGDGLLPDGAAVRRVTSDGLWVERDGVESLLTEMSDGYRTVLALVVDRRTARSSVRRPARGG